MCAGKYNNLNVPNVTLVEVRAYEVQERKCEVSHRLGRCDMNCDDCIYYDENLEEFLDLYEKQMSDIL